MLTDAEWEVVRAWVGQEPTDDEIDARYDRFGNIDRVIEETLRDKLSKLIEQPESFTLNDGTSMSTGANMTALQEMLHLFIARGGSEPDTEEDIPGEMQIVKISRGHYYNHR